jgi:murein L,D-transpeptidase YafK
MKKTFAVASLVILGLAIGSFVMGVWPKKLQEVATSVVISKLPENVGRHIVNASRVPLQHRLDAKGFRLGQKAHLRLFKSESVLEVWMKNGESFTLFETYPICSWSGQLGPKQREGDGQSPEGFYVVSKKHLKPDSSYYRAINVGYPNAYDRALGRTGSFLMIHGSCVSIGCYAMTNAGIDDIYKIVEAAMKTGDVAIHIFPFRMTKDNLSRQADSKWINFWRNLAEGDRQFRASGQPPAAFACNRSYGFGADAAKCEKIAAW